MDCFLFTDYWSRGCLQYSVNTHSTEEEYFLEEEFSWRRKLRNNHRWNSGRFSVKNDNESFAAAGKAAIHVAE